MSHDEANSGPRISVVLLTRDRRDDALRCVSRLVELPDRPEVIVVDSASSDGTADAIARRFPAVCLVVLEEDLGAAGRNVGVRAARAPYVAFSDEDSGWAPGALSLAADLLDEHTGVGLLAAHVVLEGGRRDDPGNESLKNSPLGTEPGLPGPLILSFHASAAVVRKEAFLEAGGFERRFLFGGEEELLALDMSSFGWELVYVDAVRAHRFVTQRPDPAALQRRAVRNGLWTTWLRRRGAGLALGTRAVLRGTPSPLRRWQGAVQALGGLPWVLRQRRRLPPRVELELRRMERKGLPPPSATSPTAARRASSS